MAGFIQSVFVEKMYTLIRVVHEVLHEYTMDDDALTAFQIYHDNLVHCQNRQVNDNIQGILSKAHGYVARLSVVLFVSQQALESVLEGGNPESPCTWLATITEDCVKASAQIIDY